MYQNDYLLKLLGDFVQAIMRSMIVAKAEDNPYAAARSLEIAIGNAVDMDAALFLALEPNSMTSMLAISPMDANVAGYVARSLALASVYSRRAGEAELADLRIRQARAVSDAYGCQLSEEDFASDVTIEEATAAMEAFLNANQ